MNTGPSIAAPTTSPAPIATVAEADKLADHFSAVTTELVRLLQQETELVRAGRLGAAVELAQSKAELTLLYVADASQLRASQHQVSHVAPDRLAALRAQHDAFRALLETNLTVLATANAVSEGIVRGVSNELARKSAPQTYGATGQANAPSRSAAQPLAISRTL